MGQHYMTERERYQLEAYLRAGKGVAWVARTMGFCRKTIYNEMHRGAVRVVRYVNGIQRDVVEYSADKGQQVHTYNQTAKGKPLKVGNRRDYTDRLEALMLGIQANGTADRAKRYSPAAALAQTRREGYPIRICTTTLYSYIEKGVFRHLTRKDLWEPRKKKNGQRHESRIAHPHLPSIENRPAPINDRLEPWHWETDTVVGGAKTRAALLTMTDRKTRREAIIKTPDKTAESMLRALAHVNVPIRTITTDNGPEFLAYAKMRSILPGLQEVYYCHSYAAWEKGTNEIQNRMIRRWFPKGTDFGQVTQEELDDLAEWMNHYPRRVLGWKCPADFY